MRKMHGPGIKSSAGLALPVLLAASLLACGDDVTSRVDALDVTTGIDVSDADIADADPGTDLTTAPDNGDATGEATSSDVDPEVGDDVVVTAPDVDEDTGTTTTTDTSGEVVEPCPPIPTAPCEVSNPIGTCVGAWTCGGGAWSCDARTPAAEVCDGIDNDCDGAVDDGFKDPVTGLYDRDDACGSCAIDCTSGLGPDEHAYGRCDAGTGAPTCALVCCTAADPHASCDGSDWQDGNLQAGDGCEDRVVRACQDEDDCPQSERCIDLVCVPNVPGGPCVTRADCAPGDVCVGGICGCAGESYAADAVPPNVLIVLDRSSSMNQLIGEWNRSKWDLAKDAVRSLTETYDAQVRFGLKLFPGIDQAGTRGPSACGPGAVWVDTGATNAGAINTFLAAAGTSSGTPIAEALRSLLDYGGLEDTTRANYVILITDGESSCDPPVPEVEALLAQSPSIRTFVIGFGGEVDAGELNAMAEAGDTALPGDTKYYQADDPLSLGNALDTIVGSVLGCNYALQGVPPGLDGLGVYFDTVAQPFDPSHENGWDYDLITNQVTLHGAACGAVLDGAVDDLAIVYGCPNPIIIGR